MIYNKKGVSVLVGYILLVVFAVIISAIVFVWLRSYVPAETLNCPEGTSVFIKESSFNDSNSQLKLVLKNNGRFDIAGFFIHATNSSSQEVATFDLSNYSIDRTKIFGNSIVYEIGSNSMKPGDTNTSTFDLSVSSIGRPYSVSIIPVRYQVENNRERFVSCSNAKTGSKITTPGVEIPEVQCSDGLDNDGDGCIDIGDNDCSNSFDTTESGSTCNTCTPTSEICNDGLDNDCDGFVDCLDSNCNADPSCVTTPECSDGLDNDGNGCSDFPADSGCANASDADEAGGTCTGSGVGTELNYFGFESGTQGWTDGDGGGSRSVWTNTKSKKQDDGTDGGSHSWKISQNQAGSYTAETFNFAPYNQIKIGWWGFYTGLETNQNDCFELRIDNVKVTSWGTLCDNSVTQDQWIAQEVTIDRANYNFDNSVEVRFKGEANNENDEFYIDGIRITGIA